MFQRHIQEEKLVDYALEQLSSKEHFKVNAHVANCKKCSTALRYWQTTLQLETELNPSERLKNKTLLAIDEKGKRRYSIPKYVWVTTVLTIIFLSLVTYANLPVTDIAIEKNDPLVQTPVDDKFLSQITLTGKTGQLLHEKWINENSDITFISHFYPERLDNQSYLPFSSSFSFKHEWYYVNNDLLCSLDSRNNIMSCVRFTFDNKTNQWVPYDFILFKHR